ncbi:GPW/gp25 family protein [Salipiger sp. IMCC34102]|uniref:GPW/gp25 family protein n=1 Tax=Salipiger sp. IMCC34102 TaxID=2510647 RepID=UPI001F5C2F67|nr:GPW/gp25 family protein [Salipiger sp. IMCC34102]
MNSETGRAIGGMAHLRQSIRDILSTPIGSRVLRRDYGSRLYQLVDRPYSAGLRLQLIAATAEAIAAWEPRVVVKRVRIDRLALGELVVSLTMTLVAEERDLVLDGVVVS